MFFAHTAFGSYSPTNDFVELDTNVSFEPQAFSGAGLNENYTPVLLFNVGGNNCLIPLNEQIRSKLNTQETLKQNSLDEAFAFKKMTNVKPCQAEITQLVLDSLDKQANQLAIAPTPGLLVAGAIYVGFCGAGDYALYNRRHNKQNLLDAIKNADTKTSTEEAYLLAMEIVTPWCLPIYAVGSLIRWGINDGQDPVLDDF